VSSSRDGVQTVEIELAQKILDCEGHTYFKFRSLSTKSELMIQRESATHSHTRCAIWQPGL